MTSQRHLGILLAIKFAKQQCSSQRHCGYSCPHWLSSHEDHVLLTQLANLAFSTHLPLRSSAAFFRAYASRTGFGCSCADIYILSVLLMVKHSGRSPFHTLLLIITTCILTHLPRTLRSLFSLLPAPLWQPSNLGDNAEVTTGEARQRVSVDGRARSPMSGTPSVSREEIQTPSLNQPRCRL
jgi:hypothetical protein